jgi:hypothetical protein
MHRADKMELAFRMIQADRKTTLRDKFAKDLKARPWVLEEIKMFEEAHDRLTERGVQLVRDLCEEIVLH